MPNFVLRIPKLLDQLESAYGKQESTWPPDPYMFLVWWHCGYPASDRACAKGWDSLTQQIGTDPDSILSARPATLAGALKSGGMLPEIRAERLKEIAARVQEEFGGDLRAALVGPMATVRKTLKSFPGIADPGADRILLFAGIAPVAAVPSNCAYVLVRLQQGPEGKNYAATYREAQRILEAQVPAKFDARTRAYLLLKRHAQETCKLTNPRCSECRVKSICAYFAAMSSRTSSPKAGKLKTKSA
jgi:endonuclease-3